MTITREPLCQTRYCPAPSDFDFHACVHCGSTTIEHHHVEGRGKTRTMDKKKVVPLCVPIHKKISLNEYGDAILDLDGSKLYRIWALHNETVHEGVHWWMQPDKRRGHLVPEENNEANREGEQGLHRVRPAGQQSVSEVRPQEDDHQEEVAPVLSDGAEEAGTPRPPYERVSGPSTEAPETAPVHTSPSVSAPSPSTGLPPISKSQARRLAIQRPVLSAAAEGKDMPAQVVSASPSAAALSVGAESSNEGVDVRSVLSASAPALDKEEGDAAMVDAPDSGDVVVGVGVSAPSNRSDSHSSLELNPAGEKEEGDEGTDNRNLGIGGVGANDGDSHVAGQQPPASEDDSSLSVNHSASPNAAPARSALSPLDEWCRRGMAFVYNGERLDALTDEWRFQVGDWLNEGEGMMPEEVHGYLRGFRSPMALRQYAWVAAKVTRVTGLSWSHCRAVAALPPPEQRFALEQAVRGNWPTRQLRDWLDERSDGSQRQPTSTGRCPSCSFTAPLKVFKEGS